jgi:hypothetical protein
MKDKEKNPMLETADEAMKGYEQALRSGLQFQQEAWQAWFSMLNQSSSTQDWQKYFAHASAAVTGLMPTAHKRMEEGLELLEQNSKAGTELVKKALDAAQASTFNESQSKWMDFWKGSVCLARTNAEAAMMINSRALDSWVNLVQKNSEPAKGTAAKAA